MIIKLIKSINLEHQLINFLYPVKNFFVINNNFFTIKKIIKDNNFIISICYFNINQFNNFINIQKKLIISVPYKIKIGSEKRKAEYVASRLLVKNILSHFGYKNFLLRNNINYSPIWPRKINGSLSHSDGVIVLVVTKNNTYLGIDIEKYITKNVSKDIFNLLLTSYEKKYIQTLNKPLYQCITLIFSLKESFYKAFYSRFNKPINFHNIIIKEINFINNTAIIFLSKKNHLKYFNYSKVKIKFFMSNKYVLTLVIVYIK